MAVGVRREGLFPRDRGKRPSEAVPEPTVQGGRDAEGRTVPGPLGLQERRLACILA